MPPLKSIAVPVKRLKVSHAKRRKPMVPAAELPTVAAVQEPRRASMSPVVAQPSHRYRIGERLALAGGGGAFSRAGAYCKVVARLPYEGHGSLLYRVRSDAEQFERVVAEMDLSRPGHEEP